MSYYKKYKDVKCTINKIDYYFGSSNQLEAAFTEGYNRLPYMASVIIKEGSFIKCRVYGSALANEVLRVFGLTTETFMFNMNSVAQDALVKHLEKLE